MYAENRAIVLQIRRSVCMKDLIPIYRIFRIFANVAMIFFYKKIVDYRSHFEGVAVGGCGGSTAVASQFHTGLN